ncbi:MAG: hypothetical protein LW832_09770 [Parachlamydia sp.]|jgi:hypothetical protein|nr:hypothetical protein [Parachlamydia sp.]
MKIYYRLLVLLALLLAHQGRASDALQLYVTNPHYDPGLFSVFCSIVGVLDHYDQNTRTYNGLEVILNSGQYFDPKAGGNWWDYFFEPLCIQKSPHFIPFILTDGELSAYAWHTALQMDPRRTFELINKYIRLNVKMQAKVDQFAESHFKDFFVIGIHYRGTDKYTEARRVEYDEMEQAIRQVISVNEEKNLKLFVATDEEEFLQFIKSRFHQPLCFIEAERSQNSLPVHYFSYKENNYQKGEDAVMDCYLLSRVNFLIRTSSNLSLISERLDLSLPVRLLN